MKNNLYFEKIFLIFIEYIFYLLIVILKNKEY